MRLKTSAIFLAAAFAAVAAAPSAQPVDAPAAEDQSELDAAWDRFLGKQQQALDLVKSREQVARDPQQRAEGYRLIMQQAVDAIRVSALHDPMAPQFTNIAAIGAKSGMDNPDTEYQMAMIDGSQAYRITGQWRSGRQLFIQSVGGQPGVGKAGPGDIIATLVGSDLEVAEDGSFTIEVSGERPDGAANWLELKPRAGSVLVRFTDAEWLTDARPDWVRIERVCENCPTAPDAATPDIIAKQLDRAGEALHDRTASWLRIADLVWGNFPRNGVGPARPTPNGLTGQFSAWGTFKLADDEALIVAVPASDAPYQGVQLANRWFTSLDYRNRQSSLTSRQAHVDSDGMIRLVVSARDPGVWNWLDSEGHREGLIMLRWQGAASVPSPAPSGQLVKLANLGQALPTDTRKVSSTERAQQIERRIEAIDLRNQ